MNKFFSEERKNQFFSFNKGTKRKKEKNKEERKKERKKERSYGVRNP